MSAREKVGKRKLNEKIERENILLERMRETDAGRDKVRLIM